MKHCTKHWWLLRLTSLPIIPLFFYFLCQPGMFAHDRAAFVAWAAEPLTAGLLAVFVVCSFIHAAMGLEEVILDYVPDAHAQKAALLANKSLFFLMAAVSIVAIITFSLGN